MYLKWSEEEERTKLLLDLDFGDGTKQTFDLDSGPLLHDMHKWMDGSMSSTPTTSSQG